MTVSVGLQWNPWLEPVQASYSESDLWMDEVTGSWSDSWFQLDQQFCGDVWMRAFTQHWEACIPLFRTQRCIVVCDQTWLNWGHLYTSRCSQRTFVQDPWLKCSFSTELWLVVCSISTWTLVQHQICLLKLGMNGNPWLCAATVDWGLEAVWATLVSCYEGSLNVNIHGSSECTFECHLATSASSISITQAWLFLLVLDGLFPL